VFAGATRIVSKLEMPPTGSGQGGGATNLAEVDQYFYHQDHLDSTGYVTGFDGEVYQHLEYFPFGEQWVNEVVDNTRVKYRFTGKEYDGETGLYYFGARYYDPRTSVWQSPDPEIGQYISTAKADYVNPSLDNDWRTRLTGAGMGGAFNPRNLNNLGYAHQNPIKFTDPTGRCVDACVGEAAVAVLLTRLLMTAIVAKGVSDQISQPHNWAPPVAGTEPNYAVRYRDELNSAVRTDAGVAAAVQQGQKVLIVSRTLTPNIARETAVALTNGKPSILTRAALGTQGVRRAQALSAAGVVAGAGQSLDEYPFATTNEGGAGAHVSAVPRAEQNLQGGLLNAFYVTQGINPGDQFKVIVIP
jgi:RHS repeat-associated protein